MKLKLAVSADLREDGSVHTNTFKRAILYSLEHCYNQYNIEYDVVWVNDSANQAGGISAAKKIIHLGVDAVVGHYASSAAAAAAPLYQISSIPVLLPAATDPAITNENANAFRVCGSDEQLAQYITQYLSGESKKILYIDNDGSLHGKSLSASIKYQADQNHLTVSDNFDQANSIVYAGSYNASVNYLNTINTTGKKIYLTDDAVSNKLAQEINSTISVTVFGFSVYKNTDLYKTVSERYRAEYGKHLGVYFCETFAAIQIIFEQFKKNGKISSKELDAKFNTIMGKIALNEKSELINSRYSIWTIQNNTLVENIKTEFVV